MVELDGHGDHAGVKVLEALLHDVEVLGEVKLELRHVLLELVVDVLQHEEMLLDVRGEVVDALPERGHLHHRLRLHGLELPLPRDLVDELGHVRLIGLPVDEVELLHERVLHHEEVVVVARELLIAAVHALSDLADRPDNERAELVGRISWGRSWRPEGRTLGRLHRVLGDPLSLRRGGALWGRVGGCRWSLGPRRLPRGVAEEVHERVLLDR